MLILQFTDWCQICCLGDMRLGSHLGLGLKHLVQCTSLLNYARTSCRQNFANAGFQITPAERERVLLDHTRLKIVTSFSLSGALPLLQQFAWDWRLPVHCFTARSTRVLPVCHHLLCLWCWLQPGTPGRRRSINRRRSEKGSLLFLVSRVLLNTICYKFFCTK